MAFQKFLIAPYDKGQITSSKPWLIPDNAFKRLQNAYAWRGRIRKRPGSQLMNQNVPAAVRPQFSRLRVNLGNTAAGGNFAGNAPGVIFKIGQMFSVGDEMFTVITNIGPFNMISTGGGTGTFNTGTGAVVINNADAGVGIPVYFYPGEPVMGIMNYEGDIINDEATFAFDTQFAYEWTGTAWERVTGGTDTWTDAYQLNSGQFFWGVSWRGVNSFDTVLFVTNNIVADNIRFYDGTVWNNRIYDTATAVGAPMINTMLTARILIVFKDRLLAMNTTENVWNPTTAAMENHQFGNRVRYSQIGNPTTAATSFLEQSDGGQGGFVDASTKEQIVTAEFVRDRLIIYFERSTWELIDTGNALDPFRFQRINTELGAESTFSVIPFDKVAVGIGQSGIHICNGANVQRIDDDIPDDIWEIHNSGFAPLRVAGIRDYFAEVIYWSIPSENPPNDAVFNNRILCYNYKNSSWAFFDDSITIWGHWYPTVDDPNGLFQAGQQQVIAGNQQGFVFVVNRELTRNTPSLQITNVTAGGTYTVIDHNLVTGDFVLIENAQGATGANNVISQVTVLTDDTFTAAAPGAGYTGGGTITRVNRIDLLTKEYNFFANQNQNAYINQVNFMMDRVQNSSFTVDYFVSTSSLDMLNQANLSGALVGTGIISTGSNALYPLEATQSRLWHPTYLQGEGEVIQMRIYWSDAQVTTNTTSLFDWQLNAMIIFAQPTSRLQ